MNRIVGIILMAIGVIMLMFGSISMIVYYVNGLNVDYNTLKHHNISLEIWLIILRELVLIVFSLSIILIGRFIETKI